MCVPDADALPGAEAYFEKNQVFVCFVLLQVWLIPADWMDAVYDKD